MKLSKWLVVCRDGGSGYLKEKKDLFLLRIELQEGRENRFRIAPFVHGHSKRKSSFANKDIYERAYMDEAEMPLQTEYKRQEFGF
ncbi:MAG: hypothetical protein ABI747_03520 [Candidatus Moraniibacteriota bacterium]